TPFSTISVDIFGPLVTDPDTGHRFLLTCIDTFTRWPEAIPVSNITTATLAEKLKEHVFSRYGFPECIQTDQGTNFVSREFEELCKQLGIAHAKTVTFNPKANKIERQHQTIIRILRAGMAETSARWEKLLGNVLFALRTSVNRVTGMTPHYALHGREARIGLDLLFKNLYENTDGRPPYQMKLVRDMNAVFTEARKNIQSYLRRERMRYTGKLENIRLNPGDLVWLYTPRPVPGVGRKFQLYWTGPWVILEKVSDVLYRIEPSGNWNQRPVEVVVSIDRMKRYYPAQAMPLPRLDIKDTEVLDYDEFMEGPLGGGLLQPGPTPPLSEAFGGTSPGPASGSTQGRAGSLSDAGTEATPDEQAEMPEDTNKATGDTEPSSEGQGEPPATSQRTIQKPRKKDISQPVKRSQRAEP
ncbi:MAG: DDE-type integrase/transposase/recombinase, partial [Pseudomonadales bacterium]|nr:DDE-type integrase/transposase/recombinase [Pseudomonadales bacterium]